MTGSLSAALLAVIGVLAWLAGQWLFAVRHHYFRSPLARRVFLETLLRRLDPTRRWGIGTVPPAGDSKPIGAQTDASPALSPSRGDWSGPQWSSSSSPGGCGDARIGTDQRSASGEIAQR